MLVDLALHAYSMVAVPLYDTLGPESVQYICGHAELVAVAVAAPLLPTLMKVLPACPTVTTVVCLPSFLSDPLLYRLTVSSQPLRPYTWTSLALWQRQSLEGHRYCCTRPTHLNICTACSSSCAQHPRHTRMLQGLPCTGCLGI